MRFSELEGAGREIASFAVRLGKRLPGARIVAAAFDEPPGNDVAAALGSPGVRVLDAANASGFLAGCDVVVRSPGVSIHRPELLALAEQGVLITTPTSLWLAERKGRRVLGITGTKGKSTTSALAHHLALAAGEPAELAGNIGRPALDLLDADPDALAIVELSSYHVADLLRGPETAVITNLFAEHADWHGSEQVYRAEKLRLLSLPGVSKVVLPARSPELASISTSAERLLFGESSGWDLTAEGVTHAGQLRLETQRLTLPGDHNALNLCAALTAIEACGVTPPSDLPGALADFAPLAHRLQLVAEIDGVRWVDDSISTTPESALAALASFGEARIVLLGGGQDRRQDYGRLAQRLADISDVVLVTLGETGPRLWQAALAAGLPQERALKAADLTEAVAIAREAAEPGSVVLLSPAAPSYDQFENFEQRGERFAALARAAG